MAHGGHWAARRADRRGGRAAGGAQVASALPRGSCVNVGGLAAMRAVWPTRARRVIEARGFRAVPLAGLGLHIAGGGP
jgi:hypothetical protein